MGSVMQRTALIAGAIVALLFVEGCTTYQQQKADSLAGGPERRVRAAEERRHAAEDRQLGLKSDQEDLNEEIRLQEQQMADLEQRIAAQGRRLTEARRQNQITRDQELQMRRQTTHLQDQLLDLHFRMDVANATGGGSSSEEVALQRRYDALSAEVREREQEMARLLQE